MYLSCFSQVVVLRPLKESPLKKSCSLPMFYGGVSRYYLTRSNKQLLLSLARNHFERGCAWTRCQNPPVTVLATISQRDSSPKQAAVAQEILRIISCQTSPQRPRLRRLYSLLGPTVVEPAVVTVLTREVGYRPPRRRGLGGVDRKSVV